MNRIPFLILGLVVVCAVNTGYTHMYCDPINFSHSQDLTSFSYYRIFLVITSESDWTTVSLQGGQIINGTYTIIKGENAPELHVWLDIHQNLVGITKKQYDTTTIQIKVTAIIAIDESITLDIKKGDIEYTTVDVYNYNTEHPEYVTTCTAYSVESDPENRTQIPVDTDSITEHGPLPPFGTSKIPKMVWAFYYPWYYKNEWNSDILTDTPLVLYDSSDANTIETHVKQAQAAGIDGFIVSWWGENDYTDQNLDIILDAADKYNFCITIYFESLLDGPRSETNLKHMLESFLRKYGDDPRFYTVRGKPLIFVWAANSQEVTTWGTIISGTESAFYVADTTNPEYLSVFDGLHVYGTVGIDNLDLMYQRTFLVCKTYEYLFDNECHIWAATICPGYDDRLIPGRTGFHQPRNNGEYYKETFEAAVNSSPDWLLITSFNEWWEHTHIEPSVNYGFFYLEMTAEFCQQFKGLEKPPALLKARILYEEGVTLFEAKEYDKAKVKLESAQGIYDSIDHVEKSREIQGYIDSIEEMGGPEGEPESNEVSIGLIFLLIGFFLYAKLKI
jgi:hypothetical protein